jgi:ketosteroid isomerase-like protein
LGHWLLHSKFMAVVVCLGLMSLPGSAVTRAADSPAPGAFAEGSLSERELEELEESLRRTEIEFAASVAEQDWHHFASFIADEAIFVSGAALRGKPAILEGWAVFFREQAPKLTWHPEVVEVQDDGELGMTRGPFTLQQPGPDGDIESQSGLFTSIWERQSDGSWKIVFDAGCPPCQAALPTAADR